MRIVVSDKSSGKSYQAELPAEKEAGLIGKRIGEEIEGNLVGAAGYTLEITGGSDSSGFPMRKDVQGTAKKKLLDSDTVAFKTKRKGERRRKMVRGNALSSDIVQVNMVVTKAGSAPLDQLFPKKEGDGKEKK